MQMTHAHHHHDGQTGNQNSANEVVVDLEAREAPWEIGDGKRVSGWTYNGQVPGPTIEAKVGDMVVVRLKNSLPEATTIHWHGVRLPAEMDGTQVVQRAIEPGDSFEYRFTVLDAGTFWYHSHTNETVQMERGLYGALVVRGADEPAVDADRVLMLDDMTLGWRGDFAKFTGMMQRHDGREGEVCVVNGRADSELTMAAGHVERWRIVNAASARYVLLSFGGQPFRVIGSSGGLLEAPITMTEVLIVPGDRVDIAMGPFDEGLTIPMHSLAYNRHAGRKHLEQFATVRVGKVRPSIALIPERLRAIELLTASNTHPTRKVRMGERLSLRHGMDFLINDEAHHNDKPVTVGELQVWEIANTSHMDHPFHLHGFFFQVLSENGVAPEYHAWKDTINVPPRSSVVIAWMPDDRPGNWMYHCHILEHHAAGMMANFVVVRPGDDPNAVAQLAAGHCHV